jgi:hypothetical protein
MNVSADLYEALDEEVEELLPNPVDRSQMNAVNVLGHTGRGNTQLS